MSERAKATAKTPEAKKNKFASKIQKSDFNPSYSLNAPINQIMFLQRNIGNQAVQGLLHSGALQTKLKIGQPNDMYEQEADRAAEQVIKMSEHQCPECEEEQEQIQQKPLSSTIHPVIQRQIEEEEEVEVQVQKTIQRQAEPQEEEEEELIQTKVADDVQVQQQKDESVGMTKSDADPQAVSSNIQKPT